MVNNGDENGDEHGGENGDWLLPLFILMKTV